MLTKEAAAATDLECCRLGLVWTTVVHLGERTRASLDGDTCRIVDDVPGSRLAANRHQLNARLAVRFGDYRSGQTDYAVSKVYS